MGRYLKNTGEIFISYWLLITASFFLLRLLPGGPFDLDHQLPAQIYNQLNKSWGLNRSLIEQYFFYLIDLLQGNMGISYFHSSSTVAQIIWDSFLRTIDLCLIALFFIFSLSFFFSWFLVKHKGSLLASGLHQLIILMGALPTMFLGPALIYLFSYYFEIFPLAFLQEWQSYILPVLTLSFRPISQLTRLLHSSWLESLQEPFIRTARAKGLSENYILWRHGLRYSLSPLLGWIPHLILGILSGTVFIEILFSINGLGFVFVEAINQRDYPLVMGATIFYGMLTITIVGLSEMLRIRLDPRGHM